MQPLGCFGSALAFDAKSQYCTACTGQITCAEAVKKRRPATLRLLSKYSDGQGGSMAERWLTTAERRALKRVREERRNAFIQEKMSSADEIAKIRATAGKHTIKLLDTIVSDRVDIFNDPINTIANVTKYMAAIVDALSASHPLTQKEMLPAVMSAVNTTKTPTVKSQVSAHLTLLEHARRVIVTTTKREKAYSLV